jgi:hypothetical protein
MYIAFFLVFVSGVSCERGALIYLQLIGKVTKSALFRLDVLMDDEFIFQSGNKDIFLIKTKLKIRANCSILTIIIGFDV